MTIPLPMPLKGIRVLDLSQALAGPACSRMMADLGAEVIKLEPPGVGEASRRLGTSFLNGESMYYMIYNRNKKGITVNLHTEEGRSILYSLARISDVVLENFRPGVMARKHPELYAALEGVFNQNLRARVGALRRERKRGRLTFGRNSPCPCGSGRKFKKCCLQ